MTKKIISLLSLILFSTALLTAKGQVPEDPYSDGASLSEPGIYAKVKTDKGTMIFRLDYEKTPLTVLNFINVAEEGFYDGLSFYRHIENYALFAGDPSEKGSFDAGYNYPQEAKGAYSHNQAGILSMDAVSGMSSSSRFFITLTADAELDSKYTPFGQLVEGNTVLAKAARDTVINSIEIVKTGSAAQAFKTDEKEFARLSKVALDSQLELFRNENPDVITAVDTMGEGVQKTLTGIYYKVLREGYGVKPEPGDTVSVHYTAMLVDGTIFDSSVARGTPFEFQVGTQSVIPGWDEILLSMMEGEERTVIIPPNLAYGSAQAGPIPPNSWLMFQVEFLEIK